MRIAFFSGDMERSGGTERVLSIVASGLAARGHEIIIFSLTGKGPSFYKLDERIKLYWVGSRGLEKDILPNLKKLTGPIKKEKPDFLVDVESAVRAVCNAVGVFLALHGCEGKLYLFAFGCGVHDYASARHVLRCEDERTVIPVAVC